MKLTKEIFVEKAKKVHEGENLDYSEVEYINNRTPVKIIDHDIDENGEEYGPFWQTPSNHLKGQCHPLKRKTRISKSKCAKQDDIIARFKKVHMSENLDYSEVKYVNMHTKVKIISHDLRPDGTEYGEFWQEPIVHLKGCTHPEIGKVKQASASAYDTETFVTKAKEVHPNDDYSYEKVVYKRSQEKVCIICNKPGHGEFYINPDSFLQGKGCPKCGNQLSTAEDEIYDFIKNSLKITDVFKHDVLILDGKELDIFIPSLKIGIEYDGLRWHSEKFGKDKYYHLSKTLACEKKGVRLIHIFEDEYILKKEIVLDKISNILGKREKNKKIYARKCNVYLAKDKKKIQKFLEKNHIQGQTGFSQAIGCFYGDIMVGVMTFKREKDGIWDLNRFCTDINYRCVGAASKMFSFFVKSFEPKIIKTFLDRRWGTTTNNIYEILGFKKDKILAPNYQYTDGHSKRYHKFGFRKTILHNKYGFPLDMTETQMVKKLKYDRIWDCGLIRYVWTNPDKKE